MKIETHELLTEKALEVFINNRGNDELLIFFQQYQGNLKLGSRLADTEVGANIANPSIGSWVSTALETYVSPGKALFDALLNIINIALQNMLLSCPNSLHHFAEPGYSIAKDPAENFYWKTIILPIIWANYLYRWDDDCDSNLDPLSQDSNWGDCERYEFVYLDVLERAGYRFKSASFYGKILWLEYWSHLARNEMGEASKCLGKMIHLAQDLGGVPHHAVGTTGDGHHSFEDFLRQYINEKWTNESEIDSIIARANDYAFPTYDIIGNPIPVLLERFAGYSRGFFDQVGEEAFESDDYREDQWRTAADELIPYALAASYQILTLGYNAHKIFAGGNGDSAVAGRGLAIVAPSTGAFSEQDERSIKFEVMLPHGYVLQNFEKEDIEKRNIVRNVTYPIFKRTEQDFSEGIAVDTTVHGDNWWGGRGYLYSIVTVIGEKARSEIYINKVTVDNPILLESNGKKVRCDVCHVSFGWDANFDPSYTINVDGRPYSSLTNIDLPGRSGYEEQVQIEFRLDRNRPKYKHIVTIKIHHSHDTTIGSQKTFDVELERARINIVSYCGPEISGARTIYSQLFEKNITFSQNDVTIVKSTSMSEGSRYWNRRVFVRGDRKGYGQYLVGFDVKYGIGFIHNPIKAHVFQHALLGSTQCEGEIRIKNDILKNVIGDDFMAVEKGFRREYFDQDLVMDLTVKCFDEVQQRAYDRERYYAKVLLCVVSPIYSELKEVIDINFLESLQERLSERLESIILKLPKRPNSQRINETKQYLNRLSNDFITEINENAQLENAKLLIRPIIFEQSAIRAMARLEKLHQQEWKTDENYIKKKVLDMLKQKRIEQEIFKILKS